ncbi:MAG TPA: glycosyltransferase family 1 protein [Chitinophagales bacterium]|nr:glycosyltransferase family 1 protein [Chitinophagales bacterium]
MHTIAVNTRFLLSKRLEGIGHFTAETLQRITKNHPEHRFVFLFDRPYSPEFIFAPNVRPMVVPPPARHPLLWYIWFEWAVPLALKKAGATVFVSPDGYCSLRTKVKTAMVIHDIAFEHFPQQVPTLVRNYYRYFSPRYAHRADRLITVSEYTRQDVCQTYGINPDKIDVAYNGVNPIYQPLPTSQMQAVKQQYSGGKDYFLFVGAIHPRKNLANMLLAYDRLMKEGNCQAAFLVAGRMAWQCADALQVYETMEHKNSVVFLGHLQTAELSRIMGAALALVYVSFFEGFGIPIIEAFKAETAVITGNTSSMPEVAGNAALLVEPKSVEAIYLAMRQLYHNPTLRHSLIEKGKKQAAQFSWDITAQNLWQSIEKIL